MINILFQQQEKTIAVKIEGSHLTFATLSGYSKNMYAPIDGLNLDPSGILQEFPELKDLSIAEIKKEGIKRFKEKMSRFNSENEVKDYVINDLGKYGFKFVMYQRPGFRPVYKIRDIYFEMFTWLFGKNDAVH